MKKLTPLKIVGLFTLFLVAIVAVVLVLPESGEKKDYAGILEQDNWIVTPFEEEMYGQVEELVGARPVKAINVEVMDVGIEAMKFESDAQKKIAHKAIDEQLQEERKRERINIRGITVEIYKGEEDTFLVFHELEYFYSYFIESVDNQVLEELADNLVWEKMHLKLVEAIEKN